LFSFSVFFRLIFLVGTLELVGLVPLGLRFALFLRTSFFQDPVFFKLEVAFFWFFCISAYLSLRRILPISPLNCLSGPGARVRTFGISLFTKPDPGLYPLMTSTTFFPSASSFPSPYRPAFLGPLRSCPNGSPLPLHRFKTNPGPSQTSRPPRCGPSSPWPPLKVGVHTCNSPPLFPVAPQCLLPVCPRQVPP